MAIILDTNTKSLQAVLSGAISSTNPTFSAHYADTPAGGSTYSQNDFPANNTGSLNGVTAVTLMPVPTGIPQYKRRLRSLQIFNADNAQVTVSVQILDSSGPTTSVIYKVTLQTGENLEYEEGYGFSVTDVNGALKSQSSTTSSATSTADSKAVSAGTAASTASSQAVSAGTAASAASSQAVSAGTTASTASSNQSLGSSAGWSTTLSKTKSSFGF